MMKINLKKFFDSPEKRYLFYILIIAFLLRVYKCRINVDFSSGDEAGFVLSAVYWVKLFKCGGLPEFVKTFYRIASVTWGYGYQMVVFINILILRLFNITLNEFTLTIPYILMGTADCLLIYLLVKELYNKYAGIFASLILAVSPWHILCSRTAGNHAVPVFLLLAALYFFVISLKTKLKEKKYYIPASVFMGLYIISDGQFPAFVMLVFVIAYLFTRNTNNLEFLKYVFNRKILAFPVLFMLPVIFIQIYLILINKAVYGYLGHYFEKNSKLGFYLLDVLTYLKYNCGILLLILFITAFFYALNKLKRLEPVSCAYFMLALYAMPWLFLIPKESTMVQTYLFPIELSLIILAGVFIADIAKYVKGYNIVNALVLTAVIIITLFYSASIYNYKIMTDELVLYNTGLLPNYGVKTAGYFIRQNYTEDKNLKVFTDLEPPLGKYYFSDFKILSDFDINRDNKEELIDLFNKYRYRADIAAVTLPSYLTLKDELNKEGFKLSVIVTDHYRVIFMVMDKKTKMPVISSVEQYDRMFDAKYGNLKGLFCEAPWGDN
ncbi:MAG: glycosyltransferase family 39 protein [Armatimonadota bacterium]